MWRGVGGTCRKERGRESGGVRVENCFTLE